MDAPPGQKKSIFNNYANTAPFLEYKYKITACFCSQEVFTTFAFASKVECMPQESIAAQSFKKYEKNNRKDFMWGELGLCFET